MFSPHAIRVDPGHSALMDTLVHYHDSGGYFRDLGQVGAQALDYLEALDEIPEQPALVLDIDETSLTNDWPRLVDPVNGYDVRAWDEWVREAKAPAISETLAVFDVARKRGMAVFFITGRHPGEREATEKNLRRAGFGGWTGIFTEPRLASDTSLPIFPEAAAYKSAARWSLKERGYHIVLNLGDQTSDLSGGFAGKTFKLPNPFYTVI